MASLRQVQSLFYFFVIQSITNSSNRNVPFIKAPNLDNNYEDGVVLTNIILESKLSCAAKCSELHGHCLSYAWNKGTTNCVLYTQKVKIQLSADWDHYNIRECSSELGNGVLDVNKVFIPGTSLNGSCNEGYIALSGEVLATCDMDFDTKVSDLCRLLLTDIAVGKPSIQSPTFNIDQASNAVDGDRGTDIITNTCSHTDTGDDSPWWRVDLTDIYYITTVRILNRGMDMFGIDESARLRDVTISTGITTLNISSFCGFYAGPGVLSQLVTINCLPYTMGRYVQISLVTPYLTLCEVDVFVVEV